MGAHLRVLSKSYPMHTSLDGFQNIVHPCALEKGNLSIRRYPYAAGGWFGQYKTMQKTWKINETLAKGIFEGYLWKKIVLFTLDFWVTYSSCFKCKRENSVGPPVELLQTYNLLCV